MDKFALIGYPIAHSLSPKLFGAAYGGKYRYYLIEEIEFDKAWKTFEDSYKDINVTAPFKMDAFSRCDLLSPECERVGATNLCVKTPEGIKGYNSDYLGVRAIVESLADVESVCVIGFGGAGKAALAAAQDCGRKASLIRHDALSEGASADLVIYTLPASLDEIRELSADDYAGRDSGHGKVILEANYKNPSFGEEERIKMISADATYIEGKKWLLSQALTGYSLMTGIEPDLSAMENAQK